MINSKFTRLFAAVLLGMGAAHSLLGEELLDAEAPVDAKQLELYRQFAMTHAGDAKAGQIVFEQNKNAQCTNCHRISGMEKSGPNLDGIGEKYNREELIIHLLQPSASIKQGYGQTRLLLEDGKILTGRIEKANKEVVRIQNLQGERVNVSRKKIDQVVHSDVSLMPVGWRDLNHSRRIRRLDRLSSDASLWCQEWIGGRWSYDPNPPPRNAHRFHPDSPAGDQV